MVRGENVAGRKTSSKKAKDDAENAAADDMFGGAFGGLEDMDVPDAPPVEETTVEEETTELETEEAPAEEEAQDSEATAEEPAEDATSDST